MQDNLAFFSDYLVASLRLSVPLAFAALGGVWSERPGVLNIALCGLGGAYLTLVHVRFFTEGMVAGKGFIAFAAVIFGRWHLLGATLACLLFGATEALQLRIQAFSLNIPYQILVMLPYAIAPSSIQHNVLRNPLPQWRVFLQNTIP